jgi:Helicase conserved C-terminal domain
MLENVISDLIRKQRPYFIIQGNPIKGTGDRIWLVFKHRDADNLLRNIVTFLGLKGKQVTHKLLCIDPKTAKVSEYSPRRPGNLPSATLLRTGNLKAIENFLNLEDTTTEKALLAGSFRELGKQRRKFSLPDELDKYNQLFVKCLERAVIYRRSTAYFDSGILKLYEEPLQHIVQSEGQIRLLMDWQGFTKKADIAQLEKLQEPEYLAIFAQTTLAEFLQGLSDKAFTGIEILAELVRLDVLHIKLVKMTGGRGIYHKKTGIFTDSLNYHILHEGSDNFTRAAHLQNAESVTFFYSWLPLDEETIRDSIEQFDREWQRDDLSFDLTQEFLQQVLRERERRVQQKQPAIDSITPDNFPVGETTPVEIRGRNLERVEAIEVSDDNLVEVVIDRKEPDLITGTVIVDRDRPPRPLNSLKVKTPSGTYNTTPQKPASVTTEVLTLPDWKEIEGFKDAISSILAGKHGKPQDFLYWLAMQRPHLLRVRQSDVLDELVDSNILFEHQKSGAQHCLRVMQDFGVAVCADAVGLGKTRLAAAVAKLYRQEKGQAKIAIIAAKKLHANWEREMAEVGFKGGGNDYELYNKNLMSRKGSNFQTDFNRYGGPDLVIIDEAHEGIRNYKNRVHQTCLVIRESNRANEKQRQFLLLTATPWNNRREDIYNILSPFLSRPEGFKELKFPPEVAQWFESRDIGVENFTDKTELFRRTYRELFLQRTRKMLKEATPDLNLYAKRVAEWLPVVFEPDTEQALEQIFTQFETSLFIPSADPIRYLSGNNEQRSLLANQRRFFLQRAESSMYALSRTIKNFGNRISLVKHRLENVAPDADGLKEFLLLHYGFETERKNEPLDFLDLNEDWDEDYLEDEEDETNEKKEEKRQKLSNAIENATDALRDKPDRAKQIYNRILDDCDRDLAQLAQIQKLLADEFVKDHKREQVTRKVKELVKEGHKVLLISTFSDTVIDYYRYMANQSAIAAKGIGMAMGSIKSYYPSNSDKPINVSQNNVLKGTRQQNGLKRQQIFRLFAPVATCKNPAERPHPEEEIAVLIGSETLSVGQNLQDADYIINIDLPWNPMILEQRIGRIDRPKQHHVDNIYIYYANSENQLLRQASRLSNLNKKLVGDLVTQNNAIPSISSVDALGASVYGDTYFDDEILPGYINFITSLVKARRVEQGSLQEETYQKQETNRDLYTHNEILHSEELRKLVERLGENCQVNPLAIGHCTNEPEEPTGLVALTLEYFGPNGEPICDRKEIIYWNDQTQENDGYGRAIATAFKTPEAGEVVSVKNILTLAQNLYDKLVLLKQQYQTELEQPETLGNINLTSERISKIQKRVITMNSLPEAVDRKMVRETLKKLSQHTEQKQVQKLLREFTDGDKSQLKNDEFIKQLVNDTQLLNLLGFEGIKPTTLKASLSALLLRTELGEK